MYLIKKHMYIFFLYFFLILLLIFDLVFTKYKYTHTFFIKRNQTLSYITTNLYKEKIINNKFFFKLAVRLALAEKILKAGEYKFYNNNIFQIIKKIKIGDTFQRKITIPEGLTSKDIVDILKKTEGIVTDDEISGELIKEGTLLPNTYFYAYGTNFNIIIDTMKKKMNLALINAWENRDKDLNLNNYNDALILASLIEKETSLSYEKPKIAQVFLNRLRLNMKLQSDPTVIYAIKKEFVGKKKELKKKDLSYKSDFNTYLNYGLPKSPICNPGADSINAATNPSKGDLLYFVANGKGGHNFSTNYKMHIENIQKLKEINNEKYEN